MSARLDAVAEELGLADARREALAGGGSANQCFRLAAAGRDLVVRLGGDTAGLGTDRDSEWRLQAAAAEAGLAPAVMLARPAEGLLVSAWVAGRVLTRDAAREPAMIERVGAWFAALHALPAPAGLRRVDIVARAEACLARLPAHGDAAAVAALQSLLQQARRHCPPCEAPAACHHDLQHRNLIDTGSGLVAVDWEYGGLGDPAADLAAYACYHDLDEAGAMLLLESAGRPAPPEWLYWLCRAFDCLWYGWLQLAGDTAAATAADRLRLHARLGLRPVA